MDDYTVGCMPQSNVNRGQRRTPPAVSFKMESTAILSSRGTVPAMPRLPQFNKQLYAKFAPTHDERPSSALPGSWKISFLHTG